MDLKKILKAYGIDPKHAKNFKPAEPEDGQCREVYVKGDIFNEN